jgi:DNA-binding PadR family transcriptional regulator
MARGEHLGEFQYLVLLSLVHLRDNAYGMRVRQDIEQRAQRQAAIGAVYATLDRLERKGLVTSQLGEATPERGGRAKRLFSITASGVEALQDYRTTLQRMGALLPRTPTTR